MINRVNESGMAPIAAAALISAESPPSYVLSTPVGVALAASLSSSEAAFVRQRTDSAEADRRFLLWCLAGLIVATVTCGAIAISAMITIAPALD